MAFSLSPPLLHTFGVRRALLRRGVDPFGSTVLATVGGAIQKLKILWPVVQLVVVDVVHLLGGHQRPPELLLHDEPVLQHHPLLGLRVIRHGDHAVTVTGQHPAPALPGPAFVVASDVFAGTAMVNRRDLPTAAGAEPVLGIVPAAMAPDVSGLAVAAISRSRQVLATAARALSRERMPSQDVGRAVSEKVLLGDRFPATTSTYHRLHSLAEQVEG